MVGMRHLVDVLEFCTFGQENPVWHIPARVLLGKSCEKSLAGDLRLDEAHSHIVLQVVPGLRIGGQSVHIAVVVDLAR